MSVESDRLAQDFIENETQFHLGFLPTEQSNPESATLEADFVDDAARGVRTLQKIDRNVLRMARQVLQSAGFAALCRAMSETLAAGGRIVFSGCGATGRLSILLDGMWRRACAENPAELGRYADSTASIMTGGDFALVRSVEFFEDYAAFGRRQVAELVPAAGPSDMLVAITEGGETSSVLGTVEEALRRGLKTFLLFNNPAKLLCEKLERSRRAIEDPRVTVLDLCCGPMALAGSTRMQATTSEQLIAGAALETALCGVLGISAPDYAAEFARLLDALERPGNVAAIASYLNFEADTYRNKGKITYYTDRYLLDVFTDTTERSPTFMLPPFRRRDDSAAPASWAFVKHPRCATADAWREILHRPLNCLEWTPADYAAMGAAAAIQKNPPRIGRADLLAFEIGCEPVPERKCNAADSAVAIRVGGEPPVTLDPGFPVRRVLAVGVPAGTGGDWQIELPAFGGPLELLNHLAVKLVLNTVSTGTMAVLGRISGNWMSWVDLSNKKLIDRGARLLAELGPLPYDDACRALLTAREECERSARPGEERVCVVQCALRKLRR